MPDDRERSLGRIAWLGPQQITDNGLELHPVVCEDQRGGFRAGTSYGPKGGALPELGPDYYYTMQRYSAKEEAIFAAKTDANTTLRCCNEHAKTERLLGRVGSRKSVSRDKPATGHLRLIDR
jgi:hypothetical protein